MRILLIEDDALIGDGLKVGLEKLGFSVDWFTDGAEGEEALFQAPYAAVILDLGLPKKDGLTILQDWRHKNRKEPVLILTARGDVDQRIAGLNSGADDYLGQMPFALKEVQARLNALIRRSGGQAAPVIRHGKIEFDPQTRQSSPRRKGNGSGAEGTGAAGTAAFEQNRVLSKETIENKIYSWDEEVSSNAVEVHIHHLRKKLGRDIVKTVNKIGYILGDE